MHVDGKGGPQRITRITVRYIPEEDRILLAVAYGEERKGSLWLIRPLADRLVTALTRQLDQPDNPEESTSGGVKDVQVQHASQVYAQLQARLAKRPAQSVHPDAEAPQSLITELRLSRGKGGAWRVICISRDAEPALLVLATQELRQWLEALHRAYLQAHWPVAVWPDWFKPALVRRKR